MRRLLALAFMVLAACSADVPKSRDVRDFRILAMRADPPEVFLDVDNGVQVQFSALVVDPREPALSADPVDYTWSFCPVETDQACLDYDKRWAAASPDDQATLDRLSAISMSGSAVEEAQARGLTADQAAVRAVWPYAITPYELTLSEQDTLALASYFVSYNGLGLGEGALPSIVLDLGAVSDAIRSEKRFVLGVQDVGKAASQYGITLGYTVCATGEDPSDGCVPLRPQFRNSNPTIDHVEYSLGSDPSQPTTQVPTPFSMHVGDAIRILPVMTGDSVEAFQELYTDPTTGKINVRDQVEQISISWFANAGDLRDGLTTPLATQTLATTFTATTDIPATGANVSVYMVARDQRGGESWTNVEITVTP